MRLRLGILGLVLVGAFLAWYYLKPPEVTPDNTLKKNEAAKVVLDRGTLTVVEPGKRTVIDNPRRAVVVIEKDGKVTVKEKKIGLTFEPGLSVSVLNRNVGFDFQVAYFKKLGLVTGVSYKLGEKPSRGISGYVAISHPLPWKFTRNTDLILGVNSKSEIIFGSRIRF